MQKKTADFSRLQIILESVLDQIKSLKEDNAIWCSEVERAVSSLQDNYDITVGTVVGVTRGASSFSDLKGFRDSVVIPYIDILVENIENRFAEEGVRLLMAASIFNPAQLPGVNDPTFNSYGRKEIQLLANFYGQEIEVDFEGSKFKSSPILEADELISEWPVFCRALQKEKESLISAKNLLFTYALIKCL